MIKFLDLYYSEKTSVLIELIGQAIKPGLRSHRSHTIRVIEMSKDQEGVLTLERYICIIGRRYTLIGSIAWLHNARKEVM